MPKVNAEELAKAGGAKPVPTDKPPAWLEKVDTVAKEINKMLDYYYKAQGLLSPAEQAKQDKIAAASPAKEAAVIEPKASNTDGGIVMMKEFLRLLIETLEALEKKGYGDRPIGEVIAEISVPVKMVTMGAKALESKIK